MACQRPAAHLWQEGASAARPTDWVRELQQQAMLAQLPVLSVRSAFKARQQRHSAGQLRQLVRLDGRKAPVAQRAAGRRAGRQRASLAWQESRDALFWG